MTKDNKIIKSPLRISIERKLRDLTKIGTSKHQAKVEEETQHPSGIYSVITLKEYTKWCLNFEKWVTDTFPEDDVRRVSYAFKKGYMEDYINKLIAEDKSPYTINLATSALAKISGHSTNEINNHRPKRHQADITRSRNYSLDDLKKDKEKHGDVIDYLEITGLRRCESTTVGKDQFEFNSDGSATLHLDGRRNNTKGGRDRDVEILAEDVPKLIEIIKNNHPENDELPIFESIPEKINIHAIRAIFAGNLYNRLCPKGIDFENKKNKKYNGKPAIITKRETDFKGLKYDRETIYRVSYSLGHNRDDVVTGHYIRFMKGN